MKICDFQISHSTKKTLMSMCIRLTFILVLLINAGTVSLGTQISTKSRTATVTNSTTTMGYYWIYEVIYPISKHEKLILKHEKKGHFSFKDIMK